jgi:hypothetical protein
VTNLLDLIEASEFLSQTNSFQEWIFGQAKWACLSYRSLEGGTRVQQIIIGYFCSPNFNKQSFRNAKPHIFVCQAVDIFCVELMTFSKKCRAIKIRANEFWAVDSDLRWTVGENCKFFE